MVLQGIFSRELEDFLFAIWIPTGSIALVLAVTAPNRSKREIEIRKVSLLVVAVALIVLAIFLRK